MVARNISTRTLIALTVLCALYPLAIAPTLTSGIFAALDRVLPTFFSFGETLMYLSPPDTLWFAVLMYAQALLAVVVGSYLLNVLYRRKKEGKATMRQTLYPAVVFGFLVAVALISYVALPLMI